MNFALIAVSYEDGVFLDVTMNSQNNFLNHEDGSSTFLRNFADLQTRPRSVIFQKIGLSTETAVVILNVTLSGEFHCVLLTFCTDNRKDQSATGNLHSLKSGVLTLPFVSFSRDAAKNNYSHYLLPRLPVALSSAHASPSIPCNPSISDIVMTPSTGLETSIRIGWETETHLYVVIVYSKTNLCCRCLQVRMHSNTNMCCRCLQVRMYSKTNLCCRCLQVRIYSKSNLCCHCL